MPQSTTDAIRPQSPSHNTHSKITMCAAVLLIGASAAIGAAFAWNLGSQHGILLAVVFVAAALGAELIKPFAVLALIDALGKINPLRIAVTAAVALACIVYSLTATLGFSAQTRSDLAAKRGHQAGITQRAQQRYNAAHIELQRLPLTAPAPSLRADITRLKATPGVVCEPGSAKYGPISRQHCPQIAKLQGQLATAQRRTTLTTQMATAETQLANAKAPHQADPMSAALVTAAAAVGIKLDAGNLGRLLSLLFPLVTEIGSAFGLLLARWSMAAPIATCADHPSARRKQEPKQDQAPPAPPTASVPTVPADTKRGLLQLIEGSGGELRSSQRKLSRKLQTRLENVNTAIHQLIAEGSVLADINASGTTLRLATA